jgi:hypothetical protein
MHNTNQAGANPLVTMWIMIAAEQRTGVPVPVLLNIFLIMYIIINLVLWNNVPRPS